MDETDFSSWNLVDSAAGKGGVLGILFFSEITSSLEKMSKYCGQVKVSVFASPLLSLNKACITHMTKNVKIS